jgi:hypothetical protein
VLFRNLNISVPDQYAKIAAFTELEDAATAVARGKQPISHYQDALATWKGAGGDGLTTWYQQNVVDKGLS